jgi:hypothetical protein
MSEHKLTAEGREKRERKCMEKHGMSYSEFCSQRQKATMARLLAKNADSPSSEGSIMGNAVANFPLNKPFRESNDGIPLNRGMPIVDRHSESIRSVESKFLQRWNVAAECASIILAYSHNKSEVERLWEVLKLMISQELTSEESNGLQTRDKV